MLPSAPSDLSPPPQKKNTHTHTHTPRPVANIIRSNSCNKAVCICATRDNGQRLGICLKLPAGQPKNWGLFEVILTVHRLYYVEIKCQLDATDDIYCRFYCILNMFRAILCPSSGAREYYPDLRCLWYLVFRLSVWCGAGGYVSGLQAAALV